MSDTDPHRADPGRPESAATSTAPPQNPAKGAVAQNAAPPPDKTRDDTDDKVFTFTELLQALRKLWKNAASLHIVLLIVAAIAIFGAGVASGKFWGSVSTPGVVPVERVPPSGVLNYSATSRIDKPSPLQSAVSQYVQAPGQDVAVVWVTTDELEGGKPTTAFTVDVTSNLGAGIECLGFLSYANGALLELSQSSSGKLVTLKAPAADGHVRLLLVARVAKAPGQELGQTPITVRVK